MTLSGFEMPQPLNLKQAINKEDRTVVLGVVHTVDNLLT